MSVFERVFEYDREYESAPSKSEEDFENALPTLLEAHFQQYFSKKIRASKNIISIFIYKGFAPGIYI